jgi:LemA protein
MLVDLVFWIIAGLVLFFLLVIIFFILTYNSLVRKRSRVNNAWHQIDVQLKRRADLVPNLVETVKGYAKHERTVLEEVTKARAAVVGAKDINSRLQAENQLTAALKTLFAVAENYPDLKASRNFLQLQEELSGIEAKIAYARQFYNDSVMEWNIAIQQFPTNIVASLFGMKQKREYFHIPEEEKAVPKVAF